MDNEKSARVNTVSTGRPPSLGWLFTHADGGFETLEGGSVDSVENAGGGEGGVDRPAACGKPRSKDIEPFVQLANRAVDKHLDKEQPTPLSCRAGGCARPIVGCAETGRGGGPDEPTETTERDAELGKRRIVRQVRNRG